MVWSNALITICGHRATAEVSTHKRTLQVSAVSFLHQAGKTIYSYLSGRPPKCYSVYKTSLPTQSHRYNWKTTVFWVTQKIRLAQNQLIRKKIPVDRYLGIFAHSPLETFHIKATLKANQNNELYTPHCHKKLINGQRSVYLGVDNTLRFSFVWESRKPTQHIKTEGRSKREEWSPSGRTQLTSRGTKRPKKNHTIHFAVGQMLHILQNNLPNCLNSLISQVWTLFLKPLQRHCGQIKYSTGRWKLLLTWHIIFSVIPHFTAAGNDFFKKRAWVSSEQTSQSSCSGFCRQRYDVERAE